MKVFLLGKALAEQQVEQFYRSCGMVVANQKEKQSFLASFASDLKANLEGQTSPGDTFHFSSCLDLVLFQSRACQFC